MIKVYSANHKTSPKRLRVLVKEQGGRCFYCHGRMIMTQKKCPDRATTDHKLPVVLGGKNGYANIVAACSKCNGLKGALTAAEFIALRGDLKKLKDAREARHKEIIAAQEAQRHPRHARELFAGAPV
jgi:5-methylcytosine-specific restriction endonuclease McrA